MLVYSLVKESVREEHSISISFNHIDRQDERNVKNYLDKFAKSFF